MTECNFDTNPPNPESDAMAALENIKQSLMLSHIYNDDEHEWLTAIRQAIQERDELLKRIDVLKSFKNPDAVCIADYTKGFQDGFHKAIDTAIKHMRGE